MFKSYLLLMVRNLRKNLTYSVINISGLAVGILCCILISLYVQDELSYDRYHDQSDRIFRVVNGENASSPSAIGPALANEFPEIETYVRFKPPFGIWLMRHGDQVFYEKKVYWADPGVFNIMSWPLLKGDPATALSAPNTVVISEAMAQKYFPGEEPLGKMISADDDFLPLEVTGVMQNIPHNSHFSADFFFSTPSMPKLYGDTILSDWANNGFYTYILLSPNASADNLEEKITGMVRRYAGNNPGGVELSPSLQAITDIRLNSDLENELDANSDMDSITILSSIALFILIIASINFMNLSTARSITRAGEVGMRKVLGAHRQQLIRQFIGESIFMAILSLLIAIGLAYLATPYFNAFTGKALSLSFDGYLLFATLIGIVLFIGIVGGSYPALVLSAYQPGEVLKESKKMGGAGAALRKVLVVVQFSIATVFIIGTGIVYDQLNYIQNKKLGFDKEHVISVPAAISPILNRIDSFQNSLREDSRILGIVTTTSLPGRSGGTGMLLSFPVRPDGYTGEAPLEIPGMSAQADYIKTLGLELAAGRGFWTDNMAADSASVMLNETAARRFGWSSPDEALGKQVAVFDSRRYVVGVVSDFHMRSLHNPIDPLVILPGGGNHIAIRIAAGDITPSLNFIEQIWKSIYPEYPFIYSFLDEDFASLHGNESKLSNMFGVFSVMTVFIACLGLLGLAAFTAEQRTKEIGVRKVLGASNMNIIKILSKEVLFLVIISNLVGCLLAYLVMGDWLRDFAYRIDMNPITFIIGGFLTILIAMMTVSFQGIRVARANPVDSIRAE